MSHRIFEILQGWKDAGREIMEMSVIDGRRFKYDGSGEKFILSVIDGTKEKLTVIEEYSFDLKTGTSDPSATEEKLNDFARFL